MRKFLSIAVLVALSLTGLHAQEYKTIHWQQVAPKKQPMATAEYRFTIGENAIKVDGTPYTITKKEGSDFVKIFHCEGGKMFTFFFTEKGELYRVEWKIDPVLMWVFTNYMPID